MSIKVSAAARKVISDLSNDILFDLCLEYGICPSCGKELNYEARFFYGLSEEYKYLCKSCSFTHYKKEYK